MFSTPLVPGVFKLSCEGTGQELCHARIPIDPLKRLAQHRVKMFVKLIHPQTAARAAKHAAWHVISLRRDFRMNG